MTCPVVDIRVISYIAIRTILSFKFSVEPYQQFDLIIGACSM